MLSTGVEVPQRRCDIGVPGPRLNQGFVAHICLVGGLAFTFVMIALSRMALSGDWMPLGQKVKVCGRRFRYKDTVPWREVRHVVHTKYEGLKTYNLDGDRKDDQWQPQEEL